MTIVLFLFAGFAAVLFWLLWREHTSTVARLEADNAELRKQNERLIETLTPALRRFDKVAAAEAVVTAGEIVKRKHQISKGEQNAKCSCGWVVHDEDPAGLATAISAHWRESNPILRGGRKSWPQALRAAESHANQLAEQDMAKGASQ